MWGRLVRHRLMLALAASLAVAGLSAQTSPSVASIADRLTANALKADVSFLASDALEGRGTPSRGLDIAAEFIASEFRRAGLEPAGDDGYFQTAEFEEVTASTEGLALAAEANGETVRAAAGSVRFLDAAGADFDGIPVLHVTLDRAADLESPASGAARGKALVVEVPDSGRALIRRIPEMAGRLQAAIAIILGAPVRGPAQAERLRQVSAAPSTTAVLSVSDAAFRKAVLAPGAKISGHIPAPKTARVKLRNVIGVLRGSDAALRDSYVLVTAHYDHLGIRGSGPGDHIYNGADDDASGTASAIEIAEALASLPERPRRSVVFMTFFGEELGEVGSGYYVGHPVFPLAKTAVDLNLEQMGRTDELGVGTQTGQYNLTGFEFTDLAPVLRRTAAPFGIRVVNDEKHNEQYFRQSDNYAFAEAGVPSTTISVAYQFSDYHQPGDEWPKLDYDNMAKVDRAVALGVWNVASNQAAPAWNANNPKTEAFRVKRP
ncbi:MAG: M28 family peptidase [Bryobacteraceae bacterium]